MASPVEIQLILCDAATADEATGKVHMLGAGWSSMRGAAPHAVVLLLQVPWDRANEPIPFSMRMHHQDGAEVVIDTPGGKVPLRRDGVVEVGRPAGVAHGSNLAASVAINVAALPLPIGRYEWRVDMDKQTRCASFAVVAPVTPS